MWLSSPNMTSKLAEVGRMLPQYLKDALLPFVPEAVGGATLESIGGPSRGGRLYVPQRPLVPSRNLASPQTITIESQDAGSSGVPSYISLRIIIA